jgi:hypothetical protein
MIDLVLLLAVSILLGYVILFVFVPVAIVAMIFFGPLVTVLLMGLSIAATVFIYQRLISR